MKGDGVILAEWVRATYKTGVYVGKLLDRNEQQNRALVEVKAVLKHPIQGDLHNPKEADVPLFHQRKALAQNEKAWVPLSSLKAFQDPIPDYKESLKHALQTQISSLVNDSSEWAKKSIERLRECEKEYNLS
ncbi:kinase-associated lipoprotein B [Bacillus sp. JCM 19034]|uniref:kinase-associated lipoprotein B n=1 Tax=Bacillus sp. JCM 19034 TaxID=1481928 RepID=UPI000786041E|nr:kinase-associated lipoprotein B [Bacillus sp. JCM 19034]